MKLCSVIIKKRKIVMNEEEILIIIKGEDKTKEIEYYLETERRKVEIKFLNQQKLYSYNQSNIEIINNPILVEIDNKDIYYKNQVLLNVEKAIKFDKYMKIIFKSGETQIFSIFEISLKSNSINNLNRDIISYFKEISKYVKDGNNEEKDISNGESFLQREYEKLNYINDESVLNYYINKISNEKINIEDKNIIYPFRFNLSQKNAMENVYKSKISVIQGPPGTGKTQTILNIIANLTIMNNKTVAVVSNNNEAVKNVKEKLEKAGYGYIIADLGNKEKREKFFENVPQPKLNNLKNEDEDCILKHLEMINKKLNHLLELNNKKAILEKEISEYELEQRYFEKYYKEQDIEEIGKISFYNSSTDKILEFIRDSQILNDDKIRFQKIYKVILLFKYGIKSFKQLDKNVIDTILNLQKQYYDKKIDSLKKELKIVEKYLENKDFTELQKEHQEISEKVLRSKIFKRYKGSRNKFEIQTYQDNMEKFLKAFPVVLSTTYSLRNSIKNNYLLDYIIIDEASQVDLLSGSLALSCARNAIIVGDEKQLPQIVDRGIKEKISNTNVDICHDYFENSILSAIIRTYGDKIPIQTLREHYRCHPKIIEFCNKRFYNNELIAFSNKNHMKVKKPLLLYYTAKGNHMRKITRGNKKGTYNDRELEVIKEEVLNDNRVNSYNNDEIGIVAPYRMQADNIQNTVENKIQSDTIHKFQGREKKLMIFSTVLDSSKMGERGISFVDDPCMVNVAVSRAIEQFVVVTDEKLFNEYGNDIKALLKYIKYNEFDSEIVESQIVSVFDLLYRDYSKKLQKLNNSLLHRSKFKSENIIDTILYKELRKE